MSGSADVVVDVAILGGGIAGLWLLDRLQRAGYSVALFETEALGAGQSVASQGIIHGGAKYTFGLAVDSAVRELREMPAVWGASLRGEAGPDLSAARTLSRHTWMWVPRQLGGGVLGSFSRLVMRSRVKRLSRDDWPEGLRCRAAGSVYELDEVVLDVPSVLEAIQSAHRDRIRRIPRDETPSLSSGTARIAGLDVSARRFVLSAGAGNADLLAAAGIDDVGHQRRPLHQVLIAGMKQRVYAHCVGRSTKPIATVTSHPGVDGDYVWYVGGGLAEDGTTLDEGELIDRARRELPKLFSGADFGGARFATLRVDRAEGAVPGGRRPGGPIAEARGHVIVAWPTKLALAPVLADRVVGLLERDGVVPGDGGDLDALASLPEPVVARPPWERVETWS